MCAADREGLPGARRSNSRSYCEYLQHRSPPESADADGAVIRAEGPRDVLHNPREAVAVRIGMGRKASFGSQ